MDKDGRQPSVSLLHVLQGAGGIRVGGWEKVRDSKVTRSPCSNGFEVANKTYAS